MISNIFSILIFQSAMTSSTLGPFDQQHLQHFDYSISNNIFNILTFRSATSSTLWLFRSATTSSAFWPFDRQHFQHFEFSISNNIFNILTFRSIATSSVLWHLDQQYHHQHFSLSISRNIIIIIFWSVDYNHHHILIFRSETSSSYSDLLIRNIINIETSSSYSDLSISMASSSTTTCNPQLKDKKYLDHFWT